MKKIVIGGTFDLLHRGHKELIKKGLEAGEVVIGLTSDRMAKEMKSRDVESFEARKQKIESYASSETGKSVEIKKIEDKIGFAVEDDLDCIIVSPETEKNAVLINEERGKIQKKPLEIMKMEFILADDGNPISSTRIHRGEIDEEGKMLS